MNNCLIIFTRNPELGKVKTRLAEDVGDKNALAVYNELLLHTKKITKKIAVEKYVYYSNRIQSNDIWGKQFIKRKQEGSDLGIRMYNAFKENFDKGFEKIVIIGSDVIDITSDHIEEAFKKLDKNEVVIGPAADGGYYLLGMNRAQNLLFENKKWGSNTVLKDTITDLSNSDLNYEQIEMLNDIDILSDLKEHARFNKYLKR